MMPEVPRSALAPVLVLPRALALGAVVCCLILWASPAVALAAGILFNVVIGHPFARSNPHITKWLLQGSVVLLGFGMNLPTVLSMGLHGSLFAAATIGFTLLLGFWLGRKMRLGSRTSLLISAGTAICGGSAIAAVSTVIGATEAEIAVSIGTIFLLNAAALYLFPLAGHLFHMGQAQFGLWAGVAIHDISSVVGAGLSYGPLALQTATAVKLSRSLWIVPVTMAIAYGVRSRRQSGEARQPRHRGAGQAVPWFIALFLLASVVSSYVPGATRWVPAASLVAHKGMIVVLFLVGASLSVRALRTVGWQTAATGLILWAAISVGSLSAIRLFGLSP